MSEAPIQIVDKNDQPTGSMAREEARKRGEIHQVARIFLENDGGEILLQKRPPGIDYPNRWDSSAAGHVDGGETYLHAAKREMFEELGVDTEIEEIGHYYSEYPYGDIILKRFTTVYKGSLDFTPTEFDVEEVSELRWFGVEEIKALIAKNPDDFVPGVVEVMEMFYK